MRLLKKSEVDLKKAQERQREIDEGAKLAKKIDTLREIHAEEEASLESFRRETVKVIYDEINALIKERDALKYGDSK